MAEISQVGSLPLLCLWRLVHNSMSGGRRSREGLGETNSPLAWCGWLWALGEVDGHQLWDQWSWLAGDLPSPQAASGGQEGELSPTDLCVPGMYMFTARLQGQSSKILEHLWNICLGQVHNG